MRMIKIAEDRYVNLDEIAEVNGTGIRIKGAKDEVFVSSSFLPRFRQCLDDLVVFDITKEIER